MSSLTNIKRKPATTKSVKPHGNTNEAEVRASSLPSTKVNTNRKRKYATDNGASSKGIEEHQPPVPDPPIELIQLLQSNNKVLNYFTILQKHLHQDVKKWKDRANQYKVQLEELEQQRLENASANNNNNNAHLYLKNNKTNKLSINEAPPPIVQKKEPQRQQLQVVGVPITDEMILLELSDDDGSSSGDVSEVTMDEHHLAMHESAGTGTAIITGNTGRKGGRAAAAKPDVFVNVKTHSNNSNLQMTYLRKSYNYLTQLGISVVTIPTRNIKFSMDSTIRPSSECYDKTVDDAKDTSNRYHFTASTSSSSSSNSSSSDSFSLGEELRKAAKESYQMDVLVDKGTNIENLTSSNECNKEDEEYNQEESFLLFNSSIQHKPEKNILKIDKKLDSCEKGLLRVVAGALVEDTNNNTKETCATLPDSASTIFERRSDVDVSRNLMHVVRRLSRILPSSSSHWMPFAEKNHLPCYLRMNDIDDEATGRPNQKQHPTVQGLHYICEALCIMDVWATDTKACIGPNYDKAMDDDEIEGRKSTSEASTSDDCIQIGMHQRRELVRIIITTIETESSSGIWSSMDRHARSLPNYSLRHYWPDEICDDDSNGTNTNIATPMRNYHKLDWATNMTRLSTIIERCLYAQILASVYHNRGDVQGLGHVVVNYVCSSVPLMYIEDFPTHPPVFSLCVFEAFLSDGQLQEKKRRHQGKVSLDANVTWFTRFLQEMSLLSKRTTTLYKESLTRALSFCVHLTAHIWKLRGMSSNSRICDNSVVELAAYNRILMSDESSWLGKSEVISCNDLVDFTSQGRKLLDKYLSEYALSSSACNYDKEEDLSLSAIHKSAYPALRLLLTVLANQDDLVEISSRALKLLHSDVMSNERPQVQHSNQLVVLACAKAFMSAICVRHTSLSQDLRAELCNPLGGIILNMETLNNLMARLVETLFEYTSKFQTFTISAWTLAASTVLCAITTRDGVQSFNVVKTILSLAMKDSEIKDSTKELHIGQRLLQLRPWHHSCGNLDLIQTLVDAREYPVVRVISLQRRSDRWSKMVAQASHHQLMLVKAVSPPVVVKHSRSNIENRCFCSCIDSATRPIWGEFAFDGMGSAADFEKNMNVRLGGPGHLEILVKSQWRPYLLQPLDRNAIKEKVSVRLDPTERACALSHILSWRGVERSLTPCVITDHSWNGQEWFLRQYQISGFAKGEALLSESVKKVIPNAAVCVILEDDAVLVDRFSERLETLLNELPSDFHFCSIGYSQPKKAPIFPFSEHLGIPTYLWYLTGYILSQEGASFLLKSLPVDGPVDSWIGMQMLSNFSNSSEKSGLRGSFAFESSEQVASVLTHLNYLAREQSDGNATVQHRKKQFVDKLNFRCFAALTPLCSQQVGGEKMSTARPYLENTAVASWRARDTDISYSGYLL